jgi:hypothetical protein
MQTTFDGPFGVGATGADRVAPDDTLVVMRTEGGGLQILAEELTLSLSPDDVRTLLFYGSTVELDGPEGATAAIGVEPRRYAIVLILKGRAYRAPRWAITAVARGRLPVAYLQVASRSCPRPSALVQNTSGRRLADVPG